MFMAVLGVVCGAILSRDPRILGDAKRAWLVLQVLELILQLVGIGLGRSLCCVAVLKVYVIFFSLLASEPPSRGHACRHRLPGGDQLHNIWSRSLVASQRYLGQLGGRVATRTQSQSNGRPGRKRSRCNHHRQRSETYGAVGSVLCVDRSVLRFLLRDAWEHAHQFSSVHKSGRHDWLSCECCSRSIFLLLCVG